MQILIGHTIGCGGEQLFEFFKLNSGLEVVSNEYPCHSADVIHFYHIERFSTLNFTNSILLFPVVDFFDHYSFFREKFGWDFSPSDFISQILDTKKRIESLSIKVFPLLVFDCSIKKNLVKILKKINQPILTEQIEFLKTLKSNYFPLSNYDKNDLINSSFYEDAYLWYLDLYDDAMLGV